MPRPKRSARLAIAVAVLSGLGAAGWLLFGGHDPEREAGTPPHPPRPHHAESPRPVAATTAKDEPAKPAVSPPVTIDAGLARREEAVAARQADKPAPTEEEEDLLQHAEPESSDRVIGEDDAVAKPKSKAKPATPSKAQIPPEAVSVHIESIPEGAVVSLGRRVFGRAPLNLRFRPGITYEVTFVKKGYLNTTRRFAVSTRSKQSVKVALKKKPEPKKSLFRRIFGR